MKLIDNLYLIKIFLDFSEEELAAYGTVSEVVTFAYRNTKRTVTVTRSGQRYTLEAKDFSDIIPLLDHLVIRLIDHYTRMAKSEFQYEYKFDSEISKQMIVKLLKSIEVHAKERIKLKNSEVSLERIGTTKQLD